MSHETIAEFREESCQLLAPKTLWGRIHESRQHLQLYLNVAIDHTTQKSDRVQKLVRKRLGPSAALRLNAERGELGTARIGLSKFLSEVIDAQPGESIGDILARIDETDIDVRARIDILQMIEGLRKALLIVLSAPSQFVEVSWRHNGESLDDQRESLLTEIDTYWIPSAHLHHAGYAVSEEVAAV